MKNKSSKESESCQASKFFGDSKGIVNEIKTRKKSVSTEKCRKYEVHDIVQCDRFGKGNFKVIDTRKTSDFEVRLQNLQTGETSWFYEAHCSCDKKSRSLNINRKKNLKFDEVNKILSKPKQKK